METLLLQLGNTILQRVYDKYVRFAEFTPYILGAIALFLFGWILAELVAHFIVDTAKSLKLDVISKHLGLHQFLLRLHIKSSPSEVIAQSTKGYLMFLFFIEATRIAKLDKVADFLKQILDYIPDFIIALFIMIIGFRIGNMLKLFAQSSLSFAKDTGANALGMAIKGVVVTFSILAGLAQLSIAPILIQTLFIGFVAMIALAGGLAFGLGGKDVVREVLEAVKKIELQDLKKKE